MGRERGSGVRGGLLLPWAERRGQSVETHREGRRKLGLGTSQGGSNGAGFSPGVARGIKGAASWPRPGLAPGALQDHSQVCLRLHRAHTSCSESSRHRHHGDGEPSLPTPPPGWCHLAQKDWQFPELWANDVGMGSRKPLQILGQEGARTQQLWSTGELGLRV